MVFRMTSKVHVKKDSAGVTRQLNHPRQPYTAASLQAAAFSAGAVAPGRRQLADMYLRELLPEFAVGDELASDLDASVARKPETGAGSKLRFLKEKVVGKQSTVSYAQTIEGLPVWRAGVTVRLRGDDRVTGSSNSLHYDVQVKLPAEGAKYGEDQLDAASLAPLLGLASETGLQVNATELLVYRYDAGHRGDCTHNEDDHEDETQMHAPHPHLTPPPVPDAIRQGRHYVVVDVQFTLTDPVQGDLNWSAFVEPETGGVLFLRCFVGCIDGMVFATDPITSTGSSAIRPHSSLATLNGARERVTLEGLQAPPAGEQVQLRGEFVRMENISPPNVLAPRVPSDEHFFYDVPTDEFAAVNAYYHCDRLFRMMQGMGFNVRDYFDGTDFPVRVDHRATIGGQTQTVNATAPGNKAGNGSDGFRFALVAHGTAVGMAVDWRVTLHEFGHSILWDNVNWPNFLFAHSAGDSLAAILNDAESQAPDRGRTFPWTPITRRHDRSVGAGWAWGGAHDSRYRVGDRRSSDPSGYDREQILSSTLFRLYRAIGGAHADVVTRRAAARYVTYLIFDSVASITPFAQPEDAEAYAEIIMDSELGTDEFEGQPGGLTHKVVRWAFEQQGAYQPAGAPGPVTTVGEPPAVDLFIDDGRGGAYTPADHWVATSDDIWNRRAADGRPGHEPPTAGQANFVYVRVGNRGARPAQHCELRLFASNNQIAPQWPADWTAVGSIQVAQVHGHDEAIVGPIEWTPNAAGAWQLLASVSHREDESNLEVVQGAVSTAKLVHCDNNLAMAQVSVMPESPGGEGGEDGSDSAHTVVEVADLAIEDNDATGVSSSLTFDRAGVIAELNVSVDVVHTFIGDLRLTLVSPGGRRVVLHNKSGGDTDNLLTSYASGSNAALATLRGEQAEGPWALHVADLARDDTGVLRRWSLTCELEQSPAHVRRRSAPRLAVPDNDPQGVTDTIRVHQTGLLRSIAVPVKVRHTFIGDLELSLTSPSGTRVVLHDRAGRSTHDIDLEYTRDNVPELSSLEGQAIEGDWQLKVVDRAFDDDGTLESWGLELALGAATPSTARTERTPALAIPDNEPKGVSDRLNISEAGTIAAVHVHVDIIHTFVGDLRVVLTSPDDTEILLHDRVGGGAHDLRRAFDSEDFMPLRALVGTPGAGSWKLHVADLEGRDTGTLLRWSVELSYAGA